jgi:flavin reductase (DIM6/NTAB) family NADH-FMN oxidoreductase RutF
MNIMTFCTPVSISPKLWALALYHETLTKASFLEHGSGILQLLTPSQHPLVGILGKQSGYQIDKEDACRQVGICWERLDDLHVLPECAVYLELKVQSSMIEAGDHVVVICQVMKNGVWRNGGLFWLGPDDAPQDPLDTPNVLYTGWLREQGIL